MEAAKQAGSPVVVTFSRGGGWGIAGEAANHADHAACSAGCVAGALHGRTVAELYGMPALLHTGHCQKSWPPWFEGLLKANEEGFEQNGEPRPSSHMLDLSEGPLEENSALRKEYLEHTAKVTLLLEVGLGINGGEEDGVDNLGAAAVPGCAAKCCAAKRLAAKCCAGKCSAATCRAATCCAAKCCAATWVKEVGGPVTSPIPVVGGARQVSQPASPPATRVRVVPSKGVLQSVNWHPGRRRLTPAC